MLYRETRESQRGKVLEALYSRHEDVFVENANRLLDSVADLEVEVRFDDGARQRPPRLVKWGDLEDTDAED